MKIAIVAVGYLTNANYLKNWLNYYHKSNTSLECILVYDKRTNQDILDIWPFEKHLIDDTIVFQRCQPILFSYEIKNFYYVDLIKISCYDYIGECLVVDYDTIINKNINESMIPDCEIAACTHNRYSNFYHKKKLMSTLVNFEEYDFIPYINLGVLILKRSIKNMFIEYSLKYFSTIHREPAMECFGQSVASLVFRKMNGVYLDDSWNWHGDSSVVNNSPIITHYWGPPAKKILNRMME